MFEQFEDLKPRDAHCPGDNTYEHVDLVQGTEMEQPLKEMHREYQAKENTGTGDDPPHGGIGDFEHG